MNKPKPINSKNAIDAVAFVVLFNQHFTDDDEEKLLSLEQELKKQLPKFTSLSQVTARIENNKITDEGTKKAGVKLEHYDNTGKCTWSLQVNSGQIIINCNQYDRWDKVWNNAKKLILAASKKLDLKNHEIAALALQYVDKFTQPSLNKSYAVSDIFAANSPYITSNVHKIGKLWHVHQGWFANQTKDSKILNVLNIGTIEQENEAKKVDLITNIDHNAQLRFEKKSAAMFFKNTVELDKCFLELHDNNKNIIKSLLNEKQVKAVGLL